MVQYLHFRILEYPLILRDKIMGKYGKILWINGDFFMGKSYRGKP